MVEESETGGLECNVQLGTPVVVTYGRDEVLDKPFERLYEFGYYSVGGKSAVVYIRGERNMQDSYGFNLKQIRLATEDDLKNIVWGD